MTLPGERSPIFSEAIPGLWLLRMCQAGDTVDVKLWVKSSAKTKPPKPPPQPVGASAPRPNRLELFQKEGFQLDIPTKCVGLVRSFPSLNFKLYNPKSSLALEQR